MCCRLGRLGCEFLRRYPCRTASWNSSLHPAFVNPPTYTYGNVGRTLPDVRTPGDQNVDLSLVKETRIREGVRLQLRAEAFNVLNHVNLLAPATGFSPGTNGYNVSATFGTITSARAARIGQLALKLRF